MVKFFKRRKLFDDDADWVPQKGRAFKMKTKMQKEEPKEESLPEGSKTKGPKKDPFRMTAEPPDMKVGQPNIKYERAPKGWTVEAGRTGQNKNGRRGDGQSIRTRRRLQ